MVGASTDKGTLAIWDVIAAKEVQKFNEHKAPSTGLAFSPVNEVLVLSSGLDKRCVCYDTLTKKPASTISTGKNFMHNSMAIFRLKDGCNRWKCIPNFIDIPNILTLIVILQVWQKRFYWKYILM